MWPLGSRNEAGSRDNLIQRARLPVNEQGAEPAPVQLEESAYAYNPGDDPLNN
jgi:hypothetical protein